MIVPKHKICDICGHNVGKNLRYFIIKSKNFYCGYAGCYYDNRKHHICVNCMTNIGKYIRMKEGKADDKNS